jgi:hypothetical protein
MPAPVRTTTFLAFPEDINWAICARDESRGRGGVGEEGVEEDEERGEGVSGMSSERGRRGSGSGSGSARREVSEGSGMTKGLFDVRLRSRE